MRNLQLYINKMYYCKIKHFIKLNISSNELVIHTTNIDNNWGNMRIIISRVDGRIKDPMRMVESMLCKRFPDVVVKIRKQYGFYNSLLLISFNTGKKN